MTRRLFVMGGIAAAAGAGWKVWDLWRRFGALPDKAFASPNWHDGAFRNPPDNYVYDGLGDEPAHEGGWLKFLVSSDGNRYPPEPRPSERVNLHELRDGEFVWLGHSSFLARLGGKTICIDPVLSGPASPVPFTIRAWPGTTPYSCEDFPFIDYLCISHDHWDHLDYETVKSLRYGQVICGLGVGAHFASWGFGPVRELDWGEECREGALGIAFTPSRHFSGRGMTRNKSLWGGFVLDAGSGGVAYFTGDGGYGNHFSDLKRKYGQFDIIFPDCGQYDRDWSGVHMFPEQVVMAARDTGSRLACPAHIGKFTLAWHPWNEPVERFSKRAKETGLRFITPVIGGKWRIDGMRV